MDVLMPGMDGFETAALIRQRDRSCRTPIIFLTALGMSEIHMFRGYSVGAVDYLFKPIVPAVLRSKVAVFVDLSLKNQEIMRQAKQLQELERLQHERKLAEAQQRWHAERQRLAMNMAQAIQQKLFPTSPPALRGLDVYGMSQPAETMGGDYFDYIPFLNDCLGVVIGDVSGHGIGPSLLMSSTRAYLRALALTSKNVAGMLGQLNRALVDDFANQHFVTLLLARLDVRTGSFIYSSAGHPPGYILSASGDVKQVLEATSMPLGISPEIEFPEASEIRLKPGDSVFLLTDGLLESVGPRDKPFGVERSLEVVKANCNKSAYEIVHQIYAALGNFCQKRGRDDDVTILMIKYNPVDLPDHPLRLAGSSSATMAVSRQSTPN
jgi:serine phosphatase RsbU (regulator of sigma subunit)